MVGKPAPQIELPDLSGASVSLNNFRGEKVVVLFWDPECGFCREMLPDLRSWEDNPTKETPKLLIVSSCTEEANRKMGLSSPVLLDENLVVGRAPQLGGDVEDHRDRATARPVGAAGSLDQPEDRP